MAQLRPVGRPYGPITASLERRLEGSPEGILGRNFLHFFYILWFYFYISFAFYSFIKANYGGYIQAVLFLVPLVYNYSIAPVVRKNFLCISFVFYSLIS